MKFCFINFCLILLFFYIFKFSKIFCSKEKLSLKLVSYSYVKRLLKVKVVFIMFYCQTTLVLVKYIFIKNEVFLQLGSVRPSVRPYEAVRSFSLISAG